VLAKSPTPRRRLRIGVLNDSAPVLEMLCQWLEQQGHHCGTAPLADLPQAREEVGRFVQKHRPERDWNSSRGFPGRGGCL